MYIIASGLSRGMRTREALHKLSQAGALLVVKRRNLCNDSLARLGFTPYEGCNWVKVAHPMALPVSLVPPDGKIPYTVGQQERPRPSTLQGSQVGVAFRVGIGLAETVVADFFRRCGGLPHRSGPMKISGKRKKHWLAAPLSP